MLLTLKITKDSASIDVTLDLDGMLQQEATEIETCLPEAVVVSSTVSGPKPKTKRPAKVKTCIDCVRKISGNNLRCQPCKTENNRQKVKAYVEKKRRETGAQETSGQEQQKSEGIETMVALADSKGKTAEEIALSVFRSVEFVQDLLAEMKADGRYQKHLDREGV